MKPAKIRIRLDFDNVRIVDMKEPMKNENDFDEAFRIVKNKLFGK